MTCECVRRTDRIGFDSSPCLIHGPGGARDLRDERLAEWRKNHPVRNWLMNLEFKLRYWKRDRR